MNPRTVLTLALLWIVLLIAACSNPVPPEKSAYVGQWEAPGMRLLITKEGQVAYWRKKGNSTSEINAPLKKFDGDNFVVGIGLWTTTFVVSKPPREESGRWKMTVDDVELTRSLANTAGQPALTQNLNNQ